MKVLIGPNSIQGKDPIMRFPCGTFGFLTGHKLTEETEVEVMIYKVSKEKLLNGYPKIVFLKPVLDTHVLVNIEGFACSGSMCTETACLSAESQALYPNVYFVTPGIAPVYIADQVCRKEKEIPHPVWCNKKPKANRLIAIGLDSIEHVNGVINKQI